jgi:HAD superfamily hydrolase (TIGR01509 family)
MNLVFDLIDTLVPMADPLRIIRAELPESPHHAEYFAAFLALGKRMDREGSDGARVASIVRDFTADDPIKTRELLHLIAQAPTHLRPDREVEALFLALRASDHETFILSNFTRPAFDALVARNPALGQTSGALISADVGLLKPEPAIFRALLERFQLDPSETVLIDDQAANVDAARGLGLHAVQYRTPARLVDDLGALGVRVR